MSKTYHSLGDPSDGACEVGLGIWAFPLRAAYAVFDTGLLTSEVSSKVARQAITLETPATVLVNVVLEIRASFGF